MKKRWVSELRAGERVQTVFAVRDMERRRFTSKEGEYLQLTLSDKTGDVQAICWDPAALPSELSLWDIISVEGSVQKRKDQGVEIIVESGSFVDDADIDLTYFLATTQWDVDGMKETFQSHAQGIRDEALRQTVTTVFEEHEDDICRMPATLMYHHAYIGGLLEHTLSVVAVCRSLRDSYSLDEDLLVAGALLHKVGKVNEYTLKGRVTLDESGGLQGPGVSGFVIVKDAAERCGVAAETKDKLLHMILAAARVVKPSFPEAFALQYADYLDSQLHSFQTGYENARDGWFYDKKWGFMLK